jgi:hypothetical protein
VAIYLGLWTNKSSVAMGDPKLSSNRLFKCVPTSINGTFTFLWNNFKKHYINGNKAPFGISLRKTWLSHAFYHNNLEGLKLFLDVILNLRDVYVVSTRQVMEWMENPLTLADIPRSQLWTCK